MTKTILFSEKRFFLLCLFFSIWSLASSQDCTSSVIIALENQGSGEAIAFNPNDGLIYRASGGGNGSEVLETIDPNTPTIGAKFYCDNTFPHVDAGIPSGLAWHADSNYLLFLDNDGDLFSVTAQGEFQKLMNNNLKGTTRGLAVKDDFIYMVGRHNGLLIRIDLSDGNGKVETTQMSDGDQDITQAYTITTHPIDSNIYVVYSPPSFGTFHIGTVDVSTGIVTDLGELDDSFAGIAFDCNGNLFGVTGGSQNSNEPETLFRISSCIPDPEPESGTCSVTPNPGGNCVPCTNSIFLKLGNGGDGEAIAYNPEDGLIYHASGGSDGSEILETINPATQTVGEKFYCDNTYPYKDADKPFGMAWYPPMDAFVLIDEDADIFKVETDGTFSHLGELETGSPLRGLAVLESQSTLLENDIYGIEVNRENFDANNSFLNGNIRLVKFNPSNGDTIYTRILTYNDNPINSGFGLAAHPGTQDVYILFGNQQNRLIGTVDVLTGEITYLGDLNDHFAAITFDCNGNLFGVTGEGGDNPETLYSGFSCIPTPTTNACTITPNPGGSCPFCLGKVSLTLGNGGSGEAIAFNSNDNLIYHVSGGSDGSEVFETINPFTNTFGTRLNCDYTHTEPTVSRPHGFVWHPDSSEFIYIDIRKQIFSFQTTGEIDKLSNLDNDKAIRGLALVNGEFYGVEKNSEETLQEGASNSGLEEGVRLVKFDPYTGETLTTTLLTLDEEYIQQANALTTHPVTDDVYIVFGGGSSNMIGTVDINTGIITNLGEMGDKFASITFDCLGNLYAVTGDGGEISETLFSSFPCIPTPNTGSCNTTFNPGGGCLSCLSSEFLSLGNGGFGEAIAYNPNDGLMYHLSGGNFSNSLNYTAESINDDGDFFETINLTTKDVGPNLVPNDDFPQDVNNGFALTWYPTMNSFLYVDSDEDIFSISTNGDFTPLSDFEVASSFNSIISSLLVVDQDAYAVELFSGFKGISSSLVQFDPNTGDRLETKSISLDGNKSIGARGMALHPVSSEIYVLFNKGRGSNQSLGILDKSTGQISFIDVLNHEFLSGIAFDAEGNLYGITNEIDGELEKSETLYQILSCVSSPLEAKSNNDLMFGDPCSCTDPRNCDVGGVTYFHDTLTVTGPMGLMITAAAGATDFFIDVPCFGGGPTLIPAGFPIPESPPNSGEYKIEFWRPSGIVPTLSVMEGGMTTMVPPDTFQPVCTQEACAAAAIPTLGEWAIINLILLMLILTIVGVLREQKSVKVNIK